MLQSHVEAELRHEPAVLHVPLATRVGEADVVALHERGHQLGDLQLRDVLAQTRTVAAAELVRCVLALTGVFLFLWQVFKVSGRRRLTGQGCMQGKTRLQVGRGRVEVEWSGPRINGGGRIEATKKNTYRQQTPLHVLVFLLVLAHPPVGIPLVGVVAKRLLVTVHHPPVHADDGALGKKTSTYGRAARGHDPLEVEAEGRVDATGLVDAGGQVRQVATLFPRDDVAQVAAVLGGVELGAQLIHGSRVAEKVVEHGAQEDGGRVGAGLDVGLRPGEHGELRDAGVLFTRRHEPRQEVSVVEHIVVGLALGALLLPLHGELRHRVPPGLAHPRHPRVLHPQGVDPRHLAHGRHVLEEPPDVAHDVVDVLALLEKPEPLGEGDFADHVKGKVLQPVAEAAGLSGLDESLVELLTKDADGGVDVRLEGDQVAHRVDRRDGLLQRRVQCFILSREDARQELPLGHGQDDLVEVRLLVFARHAIDLADFLRCAHGHGIGSIADEVAVFLVELDMDAVGSSVPDPRETGDVGEGRGEGARDVRKTPEGRDGGDDNGGEYEGKGNANDSNPCGDTLR